VVLDGRDISGLSPESRSRARLGRSFQDARLFPSLTVSEALAVAFERHIRSHGVVSTALSLPWVRRGEKHVRTRVDELIGLMGLGSFRDKFISELSTGSRRIVDLAAILAHDPVVLLLDEPSSGIAQREAEALGPLLLKIRQETGATMLVVEHDMPLLQSISDEILALETGSVLAQGTPDAVLNDQRLIAAYLGTNRAVVARSGAQAPAKRVARPRKPPATSNGTPTPRTPARAAAPAKSTKTAKSANAAKVTKISAKTAAGTGRSKTAASNGRGKTNGAQPAARKRAATTSNRSSGATAAKRA
jgi:ABC-type branched-subunit amino acid transport system ATPase component